MEDRTTILFNTHRPIFRNVVYIFKKPFKLNQVRTESYTIKSLEYFKTPIKQYFYHLCIKCDNLDPDKCKSPTSYCIVCFTVYLNNIIQTSFIPCF